jgi:hypothetical protein
MKLIHFNQKPFTKSEIPCYVKHGDVLMSIDFIYRYLRVWKTKKGKIVPGAKKNERFLVYAHYFLIKE